MKPLFRISPALPVCLAVLWSHACIAGSQEAVKAAKRPPPVPMVRIARLKKQTIHEAIPIVGALESPRESNIGSEVPGIVKEIFVEEGDRVKGGQPLLRLSNSQIQISLAEAVATEKEAVTNLLELKAGSRPQEIAEARAAMREAEALWKKARKDFERYQKLFEERVVDERLATNARLEAEARERALLQKKASYALAVAGTRKEAIARAEASIAVKKARVSLFKDQLKKTVVDAPFDGVIVKKSVEKGEWVAVGQKVFRLIQTDPVRATLPVPESVVSQVQTGAEVAVEMDAFPHQQFVARVSKIIPEAASGSRTFPVRLLLNNKKGLLKAGMTVRGLIPYGPKREALMAPQDAITVQQGQKHVFVVNAKDVARRVTVRTGLLRKGNIEVIGDLSPGDRVVTRGGERLRPGARVKVLNPGVVRLFPADP